MVDVAVNLRTNCQTDVPSETVGREECCSTDQDAYGPMGTQPITLPPVIWKAFIQKPIRLGEQESLPTGRPGFYGNFAPEPKVTETMDDTVQTYKTILPTTKEITTQQFRAENRTTRTSIAGKSVYGCMRKGIRFIKTVPMATQKCVPLQRSVHFENFLRSRSNSMHFVSSTSNDLNDTKSTQAETSQTRPSVDILMRSSLMESKHPVLESQNDEAKRRESIDSVSGDTSSVKTKRFSLLKNSEAKRDSSIGAGRHGLHHSLVTLQSLDDDQERTSCSEMIKSEGVKTYSGLQKHENERLRIKSLILRPCQRANYPPRLCPYVVDLDTVKPGIMVLNAKIKQHDLKLPLKHQDTEEMRAVYTESILKHPVLKKLLTSRRLDVLPKALRHIVRMLTITAQRNEVDPSQGEKEAVMLHEKFCIQKESRRNIALADVESLWIEARMFTAELFTNWMTKTKPSEIHGRSESSEFDQVLKLAAKAVRTNSSVPTSSARADLGRLIATSVAYPKHLKTLWDRLPEWMESLLIGLFSRDRTVREETCYILSYIFTESILVEGIRHYNALDICYDVATAILHAMQITPSSFLHYFCLLALMIEGCPMFSTLKAIMEHGPTSNCVLLNHLWPRLIYYALRYWHPKQFSRDRVLLKMLNDSIERAYVRGISRKNAKIAQIQLSRRFKLLTKPTTIWLDEWKDFQI